MSATATTNPQEINGSVPFRRCLPLRGTVNMTEKEIREAVKNKENYSSIVTYFKTQKTLSAADLALLIAMIEELSPEIYEHYRALQDMFPACDISEQISLASKEASGEQLAYAIKKGCALGTLLAEKYADRV